jgi:hypothetical protein
MLQCILKYPFTCTECLGNTTQIIVDGDWWDKPELEKKLSGDNCLALHNQKQRLSNGNLQHHWQF